MNQAEVRTAVVDAFTFKGFPAPVPVYRIEQTHRTRVIAAQYDEGLPCPINIVVHKGTLYAFRSYLWSGDLNVAFGGDRATHRLPSRDTWIFVTGPVRQDLVATAWDKRFQPIDLGPSAPQLAELAVYRLL